MFFASENGPNQYRDDEEPVIYDIGKLASFPKIDPESTLGSPLVCMHKRLNNVTNLPEWSPEGCLINSEDNLQVTC